MCREEGSSDSNHSQVVVLVLFSVWLMKAAIPRNHDNNLLNDHLPEIPTAICRASDFVELANSLLGVQVTGKGVGGNTRKPFFAFLLVPEGVPAGLCDDKQVKPNERGSNSGTMCLVQQDQRSPTRPSIGYRPSTCRGLCSYNTEATPAGGMIDSSFRDRDQPPCEVPFHN